MLFLSSHMIINGPSSDDVKFLKKAYSVTESVKIKLDWHQLEANDKIVFEEMEPLESTDLI